MKKISYLLFIMLLFLFISACGNGEDEDVQGETQEENEEAEQTEEVENEQTADGIPEDEELYDVLTANLEAFNEKDIDAYMEGIHPESPDFETSREQIESLEGLDIESDIIEMSVEDKDDASASVYIEQDTYFHDGMGENNRLEATHILERDGDDWKIYRTVPINVTTIDENGEEIESSEAAGLPEESEAESMDDLEGEYTDLIKDLDLSAIDEEVSIYSYDENINYGILTFAFPEDYDKQLTVEVMVDEATPDTIESYAANVEAGYELEDSETKILEQDDSQVIYFVSLPEDIDGYSEHVQLGRAYVDDNNLHVVQYNKFGTHEMDDDEIDTWVDALKEVE
ncbi:hypothetical protein [Oceanobacillus sp. FSL W7-1293]|uniref:TcaA NTF2-like domain-containing protein n=1 Tax=Oceanobacillus sp. FSL W7-1293 TaxID=2921699 RepID=UPI0030CFB303